MCPTFHHTLSQIELEGCAIECPIQVGICEATNPMFLCSANGTQVTFRELNITRIGPGKNCNLYGMDAIIKPLIPLVLPHTGRKTKTVCVNL